MHKFKCNGEGQLHLLKISTYWNKDHRFTYSTTKQTQQFNGIK